MTEKKKPGPKPHEPSDIQRAVVRELCAVGVPQEHVARRLNIDPKTLRLYYREEIDTAHIEKAKQVCEFLLDGATGAAMEKHGASYADCAKLAMFWGKTQLNMKESSGLDVTSNGNTIKTFSDMYVERKPES